MLHINRKAYGLFPFSYFITKLGEQCQTEDQEDGIITVKQEVGDCLDVVKAEDDSCKTNQYGVDSYIVCEAESECKNLSDTACEMFYKKLPPMTLQLLGWDGYTTLHTLVKQVNKSKPGTIKDDKLEKNKNGDTIAFGWNLDQTRIGDICPVQNKFCDKQIVATIPFPQMLVDEADWLEKKQRFYNSLCTIAGRAYDYYEFDFKEDYYAIPNMEKCAFQDPDKGKTFEDVYGKSFEDVFGKRRLAAGGAGGISFTGEFQDMNAVLNEMADESSAFSQGASNDSTMSVYDMEAVGTNKKTNEGGGLGIMGFIIAAAALLLCIICCCITCCCRYVCKCCCRCGLNKDKNKRGKKGKNDFDSAL